MKRALLITAIFVVSVLIYPNAGRTQLLSYHHERIYAPMRTVLLPPIVPWALGVVMTPAPPVDPVTPLERAEWEKVNQCENGGSWVPQGPAYPNGLGINAANWYGNGGGSDLSEDTQIVVAENVAARYVYVGYVPDQSGCAAW